ncbi:ATP-grasp domain-containing protein [Ohtaekwangia sp.]|uniref:ATP-grasp domain-containing protein n=1 Tax=Ohtaekwangia sp. TaxID=2066019 RepID=UPI002FDE9E7B
MSVIGLLTCQRLPSLYEADQPLIALFAAKGITARPVIWNDPAVRWEDYQYLVIRNTWDYYTQSDAFARWLQSMSDKDIPLFNPVTIVQQNLHKFYLQQFERNGVTIIPTLFSSAAAPVSFGALREKQWEKIVIKPAISAGSYLTKTHSSSELTKQNFEEAIAGSDWLIQPYLPEITERGEISMIFFNGIFSHAVVKKPKEGDFRVQRQYGGKYQLFQPDNYLLQTGKKVIAQIPQTLLYARVDGVMIGDEFHLMELELIEPDLYFEFDNAIRERFVESVVKQIAGNI